NLLELLIGHIDRASRDIALVETLGPNPSNQMRYFLDAGQKATDTARPTDSVKTGEPRGEVEHLVEEVAGTREPPVSAALAAGCAAWRALKGASGLGAAVLTSVPAQGTLGRTASTNGMRVMKVCASEIRMLNPASAADRRLAQRAGLGLDQLIGSLNRLG